MAMRRTAVQRAADEVRRQRAKLIDLEAQSQSCERDLVALQARAGDAVLDDESGDAVLQISKAIGEHRDRAQVLGSAIAAQKPRIEAAERAYLNAEADEYEKPLTEARANLARHETMTAGLLRQLEEHEGRFVAEVQHLETLSSGERHGLNFGTPKSWALQEAVEAAEQPVEILRSLARGETPTTPAGDTWPRCVWGPTALIPAPAYLQTLEQTRGRVANLDKQLEAVDARIVELNADPAYDKGAIRGWNVEQWLKENTHKRERLVAERDQAAAVLESLTSA